MWYNYVDIFGEKYYVGKEGISLETLVSLLAYADGTSQQASAGSTVVSLAISIISLVAMWKLFEKAGEAGWKCIVPFYNLYTEFKIVYDNGWKFLLMFVPILNIILAFGMCIRMAHAYGKSTAFGVGLIFLGPIFMIILAFGDAQYQGPYHGFI